MEPMYEVYELIGQGSFGKVYRARCRRSNNQVAYKVISKNGRTTPEVHALRRECEIQKSLWHPNIIRMLHSFEDDEELIVITEFAQKDLCHIIKEKGHLVESEAKEIIGDLISALFYLHSNRILHRDLKPQNVLLDCNGNAKLCDFGFAKVLCRDSQMLTSIKGTPLYMAPELMHEHPYDHNADLWSLGCIAYELITGRPPYTTSSILQLIKMVKLQPIQWPQDSSEACLSFLKGLLNKDPSSRLTWPNLLYHQFVVSNTYPISIPPNHPSMLHYSYKMLFGNIPCISSPTPVPNKPSPVPSKPCIPPAVPDNADGENDEYIPSHIIEIKDRPMNESDESSISNLRSQGGSSLDFPLEAQKEEWLECLRKTISSLIYEGDVEEVIEKHSLMLIMNTFNTYRNHPEIVVTVARLLSLPFIVESLSNDQKSQIRKNYASCNVIHDLLVVVKNMVSSHETKKLNSYQEIALQQILLLICNLIYTDEVLLQQFFDACVLLKLFQNMKTFISIRTREDSLSIVKYVISIFTRLYISISGSRQDILEAFRNCTAEFHSLLGKSEDMKVHLKLCTLITVLSCSRTNFLQLSPDIDILIEDLNKLNVNSNAHSRQIIGGTLEILKNIRRVK